MAQYEKFPKAYGIEVAMPFSDSVKLLVITLGSTLVIKILGSCNYLTHILRHS